MAVRRLHPEQPVAFSFSADNLAWARQQIAQYPPGRQASAIIPLLWRAQEQSGGWLTEPAIRAVCDMLGMAYIRGLEIATFYTMFQLGPVGSKAHVQVCGTTPCMLRGATALVDVCKRRIAGHQHEVSADGLLSWEEVECLGNCANAPMVQIDKDTFEDLTPDLLEAVIDGFMVGSPPKPGSQTGRTASCPADGPTTLMDGTLYDGSTVGAWKKRFEDVGEGSGEKPVEVTHPGPLASPAHKAAVAQGVSPSSPGNENKAPSTSETKEPPVRDPAAPHPGALALIANSGLVKDLQARSTGAPLSPDQLHKLKADSGRFGPMASTASAIGPQVPELLREPRDGAPDDLALIWGIADKLADKLNAMGIWHFDQIARWTPANIAWFEAEMDGFAGRVVRDKWIEQAEKLSTGWRPDSDVGERPKG